MFRPCIYMRTCLTSSMEGSGDRAQLSHCRSCEKPTIVLHYLLYHDNAASLNSPATDNEAQRLFLLKFAKTLKHGFPGSHGSEDACLSHVFLSRLQVQECKKLGNNESFKQAVLEGIKGNTQDRNHSVLLTDSDFSSTQTHAQTKGCRT